MRLRRALLLMPLLVPSPWAARADLRAPAWSEHAGYTRLSLRVPPELAVREERQGRTLILHLPGAGRVFGMERALRHVGAVRGGADELRVVLPEGAAARVSRAGPTLTLDVGDFPLAGGGRAVAPPAAAAIAPAVGQEVADRARPSKGGVVRLRDHAVAATARRPVAASPAVRLGEAPGSLPRVVLVPDPPPAMAAPDVAASGTGLDGAPDKGPGGTANGMASGTASEAPGAAPGEAAGGTPVGVGASGASAFGASASGASASGASASGAPGTPGAAQSRPPADLPADAGLAALRPPGTGADSIVLPFGRGTGAAAFARGQTAFLVFDEARPADLAALRDDPLFGAARAAVLPAATVITLRLPPGREPVLTPAAEGWRVRLAPLAAEGHDGAAVTLRDGVLGIEVPRPGRSLVLPDPDTGGRLLVGTVLGAGAAPEATHAAPDFTLLPSFLGVVVAAGSDRLALRAGRKGFRLSAEGAGLAAALAEADAESMSASGALTRRFALAPLPVAVLRARLRDSLQAAARAPRLARFDARLRAAQDMLALGLAREAAQLTAIAVADDPAREAGSAAPLLRAIAAFLAGEAVPAVPPEQDGAPATDEARFWRALLCPPDTPGRAAALAATWRMALAYPAPLRERVLPRLAAALVESGLLRQADAVLAQPGPDSLTLARAELALRRGQLDPALRQLDALAGGRDRRLAAAAARRAVEARLAAGRLTPEAAAAALARQIYAWREEGVERALRLRVAELRAESGAWREALSLLRETDGVFPEAHAETAAAERRVIAGLLKAGAGAKLAPLDLVAMVEENADLLSEAEASTTIAPVLVDKLLALDLPERAEGLVRRLMTQTPPGAARAALGLRLAGLVLDRGDAPGTVAALEASTAPQLPDGLASARDLVRAQALARGGRLTDAMSVLAGRADAPALRLLAELAERAGDFARAESALAALVAREVPGTGPIPPAGQTLVLRLAGAASRAGDQEALERLRGVAARLPEGPAAAMFQALAQPPVKRLADLPRSGQEAVSLRNLPAALAAFPGQ